MRDLNIIVRKSLPKLISLLASNKHLRHTLLPLIEKKAKEALIKDRESIEIESQINEEYRLLMNLLRTIVKRWDEGLLCNNNIKSLERNFSNNMVFKNTELGKKALSKKTDLPFFMVISPTDYCNLRCKGCYASSHDKKHTFLSYETFDKILTQKKELWGSYFTVISGGEPLFWEYENKTIFDIFKKHNDQFFLMYTNGTMLNKENVKKLAKLGNVTPCISLEGFEKETDYRRGEGVFKKILESFKNLREEGVLFGISVTATKKNVDIISSTEFIDFCFNQEKAYYGWLFQYMPIGRGVDLELLITPEQRLDLYKKVRYIQTELGIFYIDFWNNGYLTSGCISSGRDGGYFYVDWSGNVMPCVFTPFSTLNIYEVFKDGKDLNSILESEFFMDIREWQKKYGYRRKESPGNFILPCPIRDHYKDFFTIIKENNARPIGSSAEKSINSKDYYNEMIQYGNNLSSIFDNIWESEFLCNCDKKAGVIKS